MLFMGVVVALSMTAAPRGMQYSKFMKSATLSEQVFNHMQNQPKVQDPIALTGAAISITATDLEGFYYSNYPMLWASDSTYQVYAMLNPSGNTYFDSYSSAANNIMMWLEDTEAADINLSNVQATLSLDQQTMVISFVGTASDAEGNSYTMNLSTVYDPYKYDASTAYSHVFPSYTVDDRYLAQYGSVYVEAKDGDKYAILDIYLPEGATELTAGQYAINYSYAAQTVYTGYFEFMGGTTPSYAATLDAEGYLDEVWYLAAGTVTVAADGTITVNAINYNYQTISITLQAGSQGIEETNANAKAVKAIRNGQLVIEKNGRRFNALGAEMK